MGDGRRGRGEVGDEGAGRRHGGPRHGPGGGPGQAAGGADGRHGCGLPSGSVGGADDTISERSQWLENHFSWSPASELGGGDRT